MASVQTAGHGTANPVCRCSAMTGRRKVPGSVTITASAQNARMNRQSIQLAARPDRIVPAAMPTGTKVLQSASAAALSRPAVMAIRLGAAMTTIR